MGWEARAWVGEAGGLAEGFTKQETEEEVKEEEEETPRGQFNGAAWSIGLEPGIRG